MPAPNVGPLEFGAKLAVTRDHAESSGRTPVVRDAAGSALDVGPALYFPKRAENLTVAITHGVRAFDCQWAYYRLFLSGSAGVLTRSSKRSRLALSIALSLFT